MLFRKGGWTAVKDYIECEGNKLEIVSSFKYLGLMVQTTGYVYTQDTKDRVIAAITSMQNIRNLSLLSSNTTVKILNTKITPIHSHGLEVIWKNLSFKT
jgi:hypothetical protein